MTILFSFGFAKTYVLYATWSATHVNTPGAPSYAGATTDQVDLIYSTNGNRINLLSISNSIGGASGTVSVSVINTNATMTNITLSNTNITAVANPTFVGAIPGVSYKFTPYTSYSYNHYTGGGDAYTIQ